MVGVGVVRVRVVLGHLAVHRHQPSEDDLLVVGEEVQVRVGLPGAGVVEELLPVEEQVIVGVAVGVVGVLGLECVLHLPAIPHQVVVGVVLVGMGVLEELLVVDQAVAVLVAEPVRGVVGLELVVDLPAVVHLVAVRVLLDRAGAVEDDLVEVVGGARTSGVRVVVGVRLYRVGVPDELVDVEAHRYRVVGGLPVRRLEDAVAVGVDP